MFIYRFRQSDRVFEEAVEVPDGTKTIPTFHTFQAPPEKAGHYAVMQGGWKLYEGEKPVDPAPEQAEAAQATQVRAERNSKLAASDWTQLADSTADKAAWATYRQALRDITTQAGFPWTIDWPVQP
jgi:hypothetical protein